MAELQYDDEERLFLESEYNPRLSVKNVQAIFARWADSAASARAAWGDMETDIAYGEGEKARFDYIPPDPDRVSEGQAVPLIIFLHGGYWRAFGKGDFTHIAKAARGMGIGTAIMGYDLCPDVALPEIVTGVCAGLGAVIAACAERGADPTKVILIGHSAGGHLVAMAQLAADSLDPDAPAVPPVLGSVTISGLFDLEPVCAISVNETLKLDPKTARRLSPIFKAPRPGTRVALAVGEKESQSFHEQSASLGREWSAQGAEMGPAILEGFDHFTVVDTLANPNGDIMKIVSEWVSE